MSEQTKTHYKKLYNPDYLGAYSLEPGKDLILTIKTIKNEMVTGSDGKKEECTIVRFEENVKPMILNITNAKTIAKIYNTKFIEDWQGRKIQLYVAEVKAFGETVEALRIRPRIPAQKTEAISTKCADCSKEIEGVGENSPKQIAQYTYKKYGKPLCSECATKIKEAGKVDDVL